MKQLILFAFTVIAFGNYSTAQNQNQEQEAMMKAWTEYMTPGDMHKLLAAADGEWTAEVSSWMQPGAEPMKSQGSMSNRMIMGGRYQESRYAGNVMGQSMEGIGVTGYDNAKKEFETTWVDNMGTGIMKMVGKLDKATKTITFTGSMVDPMTGKNVDVRQTLAMPNDTTHIMTMYVNPAGATAFKTLEITFTKK